MESTFGRSWRRRQSRRPPLGPEAAPAHGHHAADRTRLDTDGSTYDYATIHLDDEGGGVGLDDDPFSWQLAKDGRVLIFRDGRPVAVIAGAQADRLRPKLANAPDQAQHALARATGNYRRGNERRKPPG